MMLRLPVGGRQLVHEVHPDLFVTPRPMHRQGRNLRVSIILLLVVVSVMWIL